MKRSVVLMAAAAVLGLVPFISAKPAGAWESRHDREPRGCEDIGILKRINEKFRYQVEHVPHLPDVDITEFRKIRERRYLPYRDDNPIARRYCGATAVLSDGRKRPMWYLIEGGMGLAGIGDNVEFCVSGFDRWHVYNGRCRVLW